MTIKVLKDFIYTRTYKLNVVSTIKKDDNQST